MKNSTPKTTVKDERAELAENPIMQLDLLTARKVDPSYIVTALRPLSNVNDWIILDGLLTLDGELSEVNALPVKPLRDWLKVCDADSLKIHVEFGSYKFGANPQQDTKTAPLFIVEYSKDGLRSRATFKMDAPVHAGKGIIVTCYKDTPASKVEKKIDSWIAKACSTDDARPQLMKPYGKFAADGYRLHYDRTLPVIMPPADFASEKIATDAPRILETAARVDNAALVSVSDFLTAMKRVNKANKDRACLYVNGRLDVSTTADRDNDTESVIRAIVENGYQHSGDNVKFDIHPQYVIDALSGMSGDVVIGISDIDEKGGRTLYISDGHREAVIMSKLCE